MAVASPSAVVARRRAPLPIYAFHAIQERIRPSNWRRKLARLVAITRPKAGCAARPDDIAALEVDGFAMLDGLVDADWVAAVRADLEQRLCQDRWRKLLGQFRHDAIPDETHVADINDVVDIPRVLAIANDPRVIGAVGAYLGCQPTIDSIKAWWSLPGHDDAENEQFYHRDNDSIRFVKLFIYLSDVEEDCGPHIFMRGTHTANGCSERRRYQDAQIENHFGSDRVQRFIGPAGTAFLEDTYGLHKGQLPTGRRRLLLQVRYSIIPSIFMSRTRSAAAAHQIQLLGLSPYINRLFC